MDDTKNPVEATGTVVIGGTEYKITTPDADVRERVAVVVAMGASQELKLQAIGRLIEACLGAEAWQEVLTNYLKGEGDTKGLFEVLKGIGDGMGAPPADA